MIKTINVNRKFVFWIDTKTLEFKLDNIRSVAQTASNTTNLTVEEARRDFEKITVGLHAIISELDKYFEIEDH